MNLISLLIALSAQKSLSAKVWQFSFHFNHLIKLFEKFGLINPANKRLSDFSALLLVVIPVVICYFVLDLIDDTILYLVASTLLLIVVFGCIKTREAYKSFLQAANRDEPTTCELTLLQLQEDKNLPRMPFGETMVWLNYRYFIAPMLIFVTFGATAALAYRLLVTLGELTQREASDAYYINEQGQAVIARLFAIIDWPLVRIVSFAYMLVGHFSKAVPTYLENFFDFDVPAHRVLSNVAKQSEDFMVDEEDCVAEPCLLVKLAKRTLLLILSIVAVLTITGVIN
ncbi:regulatory signaling modulator protein AmpE [Thalassotalea sp. LPB0316]|uniref:regulatory signaling modulator protein AmpE n=1 Tax=Thalassotalea sp. LPB0316 TaxID=2769490 RepID=UPI0018673D06|nr:regulatory signaling modulator protein AmpE [Thalassotalea sp. LPB0316]QOL25883.1 regulatory signaling modulator protein AmpE [Thalassotalea sp. LPB0316]